MNQLVTQEPVQVGDSVAARISALWTAGRKGCAAHAEAAKCECQMAGKECGIKQQSTAVTTKSSPQVEGKKDCSVLPGTSPDAKSAHQIKKSVCLILQQQ